MGSKIQLVDQMSYVPGPGNYSPKDLCRNNSQVKFVSRYPNVKTKKSPDPGTYDANYKIIKPSAIINRFGLVIRDLKIK